MPIQLRAACDPVRMEALFSDGSSGEYDASARKRRSAETHNRNPTSSFSRRFLVGVKIFEKNVIGQRRRRRSKIHPTASLRGQSLIIMTRRAIRAMRGKGRGGELGSGEEEEKCAAAYGQSPTCRESRLCTGRRGQATGAFVSRITAKSMAPAEHMSRHMSSR